MRGLPGPITRRQVVTTVAVVASGGAVGAAMAAGPVVYSEYTQGSGDGDRRARVVQADGTGDLPLPKDLTSATVSPDGTRIAQTGLEIPNDGPVIVSWLRVSAGDGSAPVKIVERRSTTERAQSLELLSGPAVWSPDGTRVIVRLNRLQAEGRVTARRLVCVLATRSCRGVGRAPTSGSRASDEDASALRSDVVGWQRVDGPVVALPPAADRTRRSDEAVRCGAPKRTTRGPEATVAGLPGSPFGAPLRLRGLPSDRRDVLGGLEPTTVGALTTQDGTLAFDAPDAAVQRGSLRCRSEEEQDDEGYGEFVSQLSVVGMPRLRLRAGGRTTTLPTPSGLRRGDGLRLVGTDDGGALLVSAPTAARRGYGFCDRGARQDVRRCEFPDDRGGRAPQPFVPRVWRYRADLRSFEPVTALRRSALRTLADADELAVAAGNAILAVDDRAVERVPLDGGAPATIARGRGLTLDLSPW